MIVRATTKPSTATKATTSLRCSRKRAFGTTKDLSRQETAKTKRTVRFSVTSKVATSPSVSNEETSNMWYQKREYALFKYSSKQDLTAFAFAVKSGNFQHFDASRHCTRGLENYFSRSKKQFLDQKRKYRVFAVLNQQFLLRSAGVKDPDSLAFVSTCLSKQSRDRAIDMARRDAMVWINP